MHTTSPTSMLVDDELVLLASLGPRIHVVEDETRARQFEVRRARRGRLMDILAHALWTGAGIGFAKRRVAISRVGAAGAIVASVLPDFVHLIPLVAWWAVGDGSAGDVLRYASAVPGTEPPMPILVGESAHHLHCFLHSAVIAGAVTAFARFLPRDLWPALAGWWLHIAIDAFTHSADVHAVPILYPFTMAGFDGIAWNTPWFVAANYSALALAWGWLYCTRS